MASNQYLSIQEAPKTGMAATVLTSSFQYTTEQGATTPIDLISWQGLSVAVIVTTAESGKTCSMDIEWSQDGTVFVPETVEIAGTFSTPDQPYTPARRIEKIDLTSGTLGAYIFRENRLARYVRIGVKSDGSTGAVKITYQKLNN